MIQLTDKQIDTLRCKAAGMTNKEVARELGVTLQTIKDRIAAIRVKFGAKGDFCAVVLKAERAGLLAGVVV